MVEQPCKRACIHRYCVELLATRDALGRLHFAKIVYEDHRLQIGRPQQLQTVWNLQATFASLRAKVGVDNAVISLAVIRSAQVISAGTLY